MTTYYNDDSERPMKKKLIKCYIFVKVKLLVILLCSVANRQHLIAFSSCHSSNCVLVTGWDSCKAPICDTYPLQSIKSVW